MSSLTNQIPIIRQAIEPPNGVFLFVFLGKDPPGNGEEDYHRLSPTTLIVEWAVAWTDGRDGNIDIY